MVEHARSNLRVHTYVQYSTVQYSTVQYSTVQYVRTYVRIRVCVCVCVCIRVCVYSVCTLYVMYACMYVCTLCMYRYVFVLWREVEFKLDRVVVTFYEEHRFYIGQCRLLEYYR